MDFWLSFNNFAEKLQLPINPGEFRIRLGNKNTVVDIQGLGELNLIGGERLAEIQLSSFFPANWAPYCAYQDIPQPYDAVALIEKWRRSGRPVRLIITETPVNMACAIEEFEYGERGGTRDVSYALTLREYRFIKIQKVGETENTRPDERTPPATYDVKPGDSLWLIARRIYGDGSRWPDLYAANQSVIGPDPNLILPGQQLVIPA
ncbi:MAG: LysM peptidoglycan-binding domain-containing protein [Desulfotomaculales bacterium]